MKVLVDGVHMTVEMKGVGLYVANTLREMSAIDPSVYYYVTLMNGTPISYLPQGANIEYLFIPWRNHLWHGFKILPQLTRNLQPDVVWIPYETPVGFLKKPYFILCHDVPKQIRSAQGYWRHRTIKEYFSDKLYDLFLQKTLNEAHTVFSNSNYVARWLKEEKKINPSRIRLAPCAPGADFLTMSKTVKPEAVWHKLGTPEGYILVFYTGDPRENIDIVPEVFNAIITRETRVALVVAGVRDSVRSYVDHLFSRFSWQDRVRIVPFLTSDRAFELAEVYSAALAYLEPSLHEGFGMQVVEAMSCGVPVVCSNRGALPEVVSDAALLVDPLNVVEISEALLLVLSDNALKNKLVNQGYKRASFINWSETAKVIYNGLKDACGNV